MYTLFIPEHIRYTQGILNVYTRYTQGGTLVLPVIRPGTAENLWGCLPAEIKETHIYTVFSA